MAKGIIYCMTTIVPGLVKIGKTGLDNFEKRMYNLERNGYAQIVGLKRRLAIEVEDYDEKEKLIHELFSKSNINNTELFAVDIELVVQLLSSFEGKQVYPKSISKEEVFDMATDEVIKDIDMKNRNEIPDGKYYYNGNGIKATMRVENGQFIVEKGSQCLPTDKDWIPENRRLAKIENEILIEDMVCRSPSTAGWVVLGNANNGWFFWKNKDGKFLDIYRKKESNEED